MISVVTQLRWRRIPGRNTVKHFDFDFSAQSFLPFPLYARPAPRQSQFPALEDIWLLWTFPSPGLIFTDMSEVSDTSGR